MGTRKKKNTAICLLLACEGLRETNAGSYTTRKKNLCNITQ